MMMTRRGTALIVGVLLLALATGSMMGGCSGVVRRESRSRSTRTEMRDVRGFTKVSFSGFGTLEVEQGADYALRVTADDAALQDLTTEVRGDTLYIDLEEFTPRFFRDRRLDIELTVPSLEGLEVSGATDSTLRSINASDFEAELSGAGKMDLDGITADSLRVRVSGAGEVTASGTVRSQDVELSGAGSYRARDLRSAEARLDLSGACEASVSASETLDASVSGAGEVEYYGDPKVTEDISGAGSVRRRG